jgi:hypothetical protein
MLAGIEFCGGMAKIGPDLPPAAFELDTLGAIGAANRVARA